MKTDDRMAAFAEKLTMLLIEGKEKKQVLQDTDLAETLKEFDPDAAELLKVREFLDLNGIDVLSTDEKTDDSETLIERDDDVMDGEEEEEIDLETIDLSVPEGISTSDPVRCEKAASCTGSGFLHAAFRGAEPGTL